MELLTLFEAIKEENSEKTREILSNNRELTKERLGLEFKYPDEVLIDAIKTLGAYIGRMTSLQYALILGLDDLALDIIDLTFDEGTLIRDNIILDLDITYGVININRLIYCFI